MVWRVAVLGRKGGRMTSCGGLDVNRFCSSAGCTSREGSDKGRGASLDSRVFYTQTALTLITLDAIEIVNCPTRCIVLWVSVLIIFHNPDLK